MRVESGLFGNSLSMPFNASRARAVARSESSGACASPAITVIEITSRMIGERGFTGQTNDELALV